MLPELNTLSQSMETRKTEMLAYIDALPSEKRNAKPRPSEWSPLQVMEHLVLVEEWMAAPCPPGGKVLTRGKIFVLFGGNMMRSRFRIPTVPMAEPQVVLDDALIRQRWDRARASLSAKLAEVTAENRSSPIALHPLVGPLDALQTLTLLDVHLAYHLRHLPK